MNPVRRDPADQPPPSGPVDPPGPGAPRPSARRALSRSLGTTFVAQFLMVASAVQLARELGLDDRGALAAAMIWPTVIGLVATLGLTESLTYHIAREPKRVGTFVGSGLVLAAAQSAAFALVTAALIPLVLSAQDSDTVTAALVYCLNVPFLVTGVVFLGALNGLHRYGAFSVLRITIFAAILASQTALFVSDEASLIRLCAAFVACQVLTTLLGAVLVRRAGVRGVAYDRAEARRIFAYGWRTGTSSAATVVNTRLDQLVISATLAPRQLGLYVVAVNLTSAAGLIGNAIAYAALPNLAAIPEGPRQALVARRLVGLSLFLSAILALPVLVLADQFVEILFGAQYADAAQVARLLALASVLFATARALEAVLRSIGRPLEAGKAELAALGATVAGLAALLPLLGIAGAAITSAIAYAVATAWMARRAAHALDTSALGLVVPDVAGSRELVRAVRAKLRQAP